MQRQHTSITQHEACCDAVENRTSSSERMWLEMDFSRLPSFMGSGQCSTYLSWGPSKLLHLYRYTYYIYIYIFRKHGYWSCPWSCLNCPPFVLYMLTAFTSIINNFTRQATKRSASRTSASRMFWKIRIEEAGFEGRTKRDGRRWLEVQVSMASPDF